MGLNVSTLFFCVKTIEKVLRIGTALNFSGSLEDLGIFREFQLFSDGGRAVCDNNID